MTDLRKAAEMALNALDSCEFDYDWKERPYKTFDEDLVNGAVDALRKALAQPEEISDYHEGWEEGFKAGLAKAQPEQEPVAWMHPDGKNYKGFKSPLTTFMVNGWTPLYTAPPSKPWVSLTAEEIYNCWQSAVDENGFTKRKVYDAIEAKLKEKNHD